MKTVAAETLDALLPVIAEHRAAADRCREPARAVYDALDQAELKRMALSANDGGLGTSLPEMLAVFEAIAYEDAAVSWVLWNAALVGLYYRYMPDALKSELVTRGVPWFAHSTIPAGSVSVTGSEAIVDGRWPLVSGSPGAEWLVLTCRQQAHETAVLDDVGAPVTSLVAVPRAQVEILDTWYSSGLRGTGSHDVCVKAARVPVHRVFSLDTPPRRASATDRLPMFASVSAIFAAQLLGLGNAVYQATVAQARGAAVDASPPPRRCRQDFQIAVARHGAALEAASLALHASACRVWERANGCDPDAETTTSLYAAGFVVIDAVKQTVEALHALAGTAALYETSPLEKRVRDLSAMLRHIVAHDDMRADVGRARLGLALAWPLFHT